MTIEECIKRRKELMQMLNNIETLKLAIVRSIAIEDINIADLKKKGEENEGKRLFDAGQQD